MTIWMYAHLIVLYLLRKNPIKRVTKIITCSFDHNYGLWLNNQVTFPL